ncbi:MAG: tetratricopeptide repeat protein [Verrucomicrobia bacterium]|nr:tetratricopeptide repeat protein [Verrucomicrobiota bacterium]
MNPPVSGLPAYSRGERRALGLSAVALFLAVVAAYANSLAGLFVFDDPPAIPDNATIRQLWPLGPVLSPPAGAGVGGRPLANLSFALNYAVGGTDVVGYHLGNLVLHALSALVLFALVRRTLLQPVLRDRFGAAATGLAFAVAGLWALHPLQTATVTYLSQRTEGLMGLCYLLTLYGFSRSAETGASRLWAPGAVLACAAGMATKEVMVTAPVVALLYDRTFVAGSFSAAWRARWKTYLGLAATWGLLAFLLVGVEQRGVGFGLSLPWWRYAATGCYALCTYFHLALWPQPLVFDYGPNVAELLSPAPFVALVAGFVALTVIALWRAPRLGFLGCWLLVISAPTSVIPIVRQQVAENRFYLPLAAVVAFVVLALHTWLGRRSLLVFAALAVAGGAATARRNADYRTALSLWADTVEKRPDNWRARNVLAQALADTGRVDEAIAQLESSLRIRPDLRETHHNLAVFLTRRGRLPEAVGHYERALAVEPWSTDSRINLAVLLCQLGRPGDALPQFEAALAQNSALPEAENGLGNALLQTGRVPEAIPHYEAALRLAPASADAHNNLGLALSQLDRLAEAVPHLAAAARLNPRSATMRENYGIALVKSGRPAEAATEFEAALAIDPRSAGVHHNLAVALLQLGRADEARQHLEAEARLKP